MTTITIYGASDDLVEVDGCEGADEFNTRGDWYGCLVAPDGSGMLAHARYGEGTDGACWLVGVSQITENQQLPGWPVTITQQPPMGPGKPGYSALLTIEAPDGTKLVGSADGEE